ncbi:MAG: hypothetical protein IT452_22055 [Planctomycetia bacterium]|nr:hypothetical protein [Planctomycetia bacterium]
MPFAGGAIHPLIEPAVTYIGTPRIDLHLDEMAKMFAPRPVIVAPGGGGGGAGGAGGHLQVPGQIQNTRQAMEGRDIPPRAINEQPMAVIAAGTDSPLPGSLLLASVNSAVAAPVIRRSNAGVGDGWDGWQFKVVPEGPLPDEDWPKGAKRQKRKDEQGFEYLYRVGEKVEVVQHVKNHAVITCVDGGHEVATYDEEFWEAFRTDEGGVAWDHHVMPVGAFMAKLKGGAAIARDDLQKGQVINDDNKCYEIRWTSEINMYDGQTAGVQQWEENGKKGYGVKGLSQAGKSPIDRFSYPVRDATGKVTARADYKRPDDGKSRGNVASYDDKTKSTVDHSAVWYYSDSGECPPEKKDDPDKDPKYK